MTRELDMTPCALCHGAGWLHISADEAHQARMAKPRIALRWTHDEGWERPCICDAGQKVTVRLGS